MDCWRRRRNRNDTGSSLTNEAPDNFNALTGTATFNGGAVGKYADGNQVGQANARIGTFTAKATFTADFETATAAGTLAGGLPTSAKAAVPWQTGASTLGSSAYRCC